jgi:hypothetical protein
MALRRLLPTGCRYHPVDLLPFDAETIVVDFNQGQFPAGSYDIAVALDLVEFVHEPRAWLTRVGEAVPRLLVSYRPATGADETVRREQGYFHDLRTDDWVALVGSAGFVVSEREMAGERLLLDCRRP